MNRMRQEMEASALGKLCVTEAGSQRSFQFGQDFVGFRGHFPDYPILPAVLQILMAQRVAEQITGQKLRFLSLSRAKFSEQLRPDARIDVEVRCREQEDHYLCRCELHSEKKCAASFTLVLGKG